MRTTLINIEGRDYDRIELGEQLEVLALVGDIALAEARPKVYAHVVLGRRDGTRGGHLLPPRFVRRSK